MISQAFLTLLIPLMMNRTPWTFGITAQNSQELVTVLDIVLEPVGQLPADGLAAVPPGGGIQAGSESCSGGSFPAQPQKFHFRTGDLQQADVMLQAKLENGLVDGRIGGGTALPGILIEDALDDGNKSAAPVISGGATQHPGEFATQG